MPEPLPHALQYIIVGIARDLQAVMGPNWTIRDMLAVWPRTHEKRAYTTVKTVVDRLVDQGVMRRTGKDHTRVSYELVLSEVPTLVDKLQELIDVLEGKKHVSNLNQARKIAEHNKARRLSISHYRSNPYPFS